MLRGVGTPSICAIPSIYNYLMENYISKRETEIANHQRDIHICNTQNYKNFHSFEVYACDTMNTRQNSACVMKLSVILNSWDFPIHSTLSKKQVGP